ncbi:transcriptional regulator/ AraC family [Synechococcus sp. RS9902]|nr:transcriptional regulator/ AraC family [Synechococcus sp. RS9902]
MKVAFHSSPGFSNSLQAMGFEMDVGQLSRGRLKGSFRQVVHGSCRFYPSRPIKTCFFRATDALGCCPSA